MYEFTVKSPWNHREITNYNYYTYYTYYTYTKYPTYVLPTFTQNLFWGAKNPLSLPFKNT